MSHKLETFNAELNGCLSFWLNKIMHYKWEKAVIAQTHFDDSCDIFSCWATWFDILLINVTPEDTAGL